MGHPALKIDPMDSSGRHQTHLQAGLALILPPADGPSTLRHVPVQTLPSHQQVATPTREINQLQPADIAHALEHPSRADGSSVSLTGSMGFVIFLGLATAVRGT